MKVHPDFNALNPIYMKESIQKTTVYKKNCIKLFHMFAQTKECRTKYSLTSCVLSEKCFVMFYVFSFPPGVYVGTLNLIASIPGPTMYCQILTRIHLHYSNCNLMTK